MISIKKTIILETKQGEIFERTDYAKYSVVKAKRYKAINVIYQFANVGKTIQSPFISWKNLSCRDSQDKPYLTTAVQLGKKLCAGIYFDSLKKAKNCEKKLTPECSIHYCPPIERINGYTYNIDIIRKGSISEYIDIDEVLELYALHGVNNIDIKNIKEMCSVEMRELVQENNEFNYDYANPKRLEDYIVTGLLLGYPIESTILLIHPYFKEETCLYPIVNEIEK